ncbi:hypothetical protein Z517_02030 [Fonsecaea pedrosoi CBS 271.37]|uniref:NAD(P)-binding domain-containing protein n=1 Tax=Fonsecaea pedrosoi CBS 271.37 TaxID=1442368 RepID=A0A0D2F873_9EURO|nr:uncharacterized protein Z517_02030 [Fonsecaea pedrosoi CBS 271.37]KIW82787.1 hypothetical protein Z517_02030 [Fonsecaea pedrosoi CBS 271.37]
MVTVAVAGGTGNVGRTIVDALKASQNHKFIVLARKPTPQESKAQDIGVPVFGVDYQDVDSVSHLLETNDVETVISALSVRGPVEGASEISLVKAAAKASTTKRFIASEYGTVAPAEKLLPQHEHRLATIAELKKTDLEWTRVHNGYFLDYFGIPYIETHMTPVSFVVDMANKAAAIPGTGNDLVCFTYTKDLAKFVVAALDLEHWDESLFCYGDKVTWNEFLAIAEEMRGSKFTVTYDSVEQLARGEITELPSHPAIYPYFPKPLFQQYFGKFGLYVTAGLFDFPHGTTLNNKFPDIKPTTVREMLSVWVGK